MRILVCGGRKFGDLVSLNHRRDHPQWAKREEEYKTLMEVLWELAEEYSTEYNPDDNWLPSDIEIISGGAKGADSIAEDWATIAYCKCHVFEAEWGKYGKSAGPVRNKRMLDEGRPDLVLACPGGSGTANMVEQARKAGVKVIELVRRSQSNG